MPRITKVYTRTGDEGQTRLSSGQLVKKHDPRVAAYGTVDELNSHIGLAKAIGLSPAIETMLTSIQNDLFHLGSDLSFRYEEGESPAIPTIEERHILALEHLIDLVSEEVGALENFILPGGTAGAAQLHVARTVCRRAERELAALAVQEVVGRHTMVYLNRLSDLLFVLARYENQLRGVPELLWDSRA